MTLADSHDSISTPRQLGGEFFYPVTNRLLIRQRTNDAGLWLPNAVMTAQEI